MQTLLLDDNITEIARHLAQVDCVMWALTCRWASRVPVLRRAFTGPVKELLVNAYRRARIKQIRVLESLELRVDDDMRLAYRWLGCCKRDCDGDVNVWLVMPPELLQANRLVRTPKALSVVLRWVCGKVSASASTLDCRRRAFLRKFPLFPAHLISPHVFDEAIARYARDFEVLMAEEDQRRNRARLERILNKLLNDV